MARKHKNASKRYKGAAIVDTELQNILQKHAQVEKKKHDVLQAKDDLYAVQRALAEEKRKQAEILEGEEDRQALRRKLREQKRQQFELQGLSDEAVRLSTIFTVGATVLALLVMALILLWLGR
ncbi:hypothetical protein [Veillonella sp. VA139]|uniref:hypothetical protein n=1 Tax=Veillonella sp. VA139 TaxID=741830 RepID=UPI000F8C737B|nr:hypothetical protein [Veillonella sp. VA139]